MKVLLKLALIAAAWFGAKAIYEFNVDHGVLGGMAWSIALVLVANKFGLFESDYQGVPGHYYQAPPNDEGGPHGGNWHDDWRKDWRDSGIQRRPEDDIQLGPLNPTLDSFNNDHFGSDHDHLADFTNPGSPGYQTMHPHDH